ncbi:MAG TPA: glycosyltransferase family 9 protein, partial [Chlamydiales bacterium]|nr:glycosyltransferase family 9 protein [Chlamydiales bacterium]
KSSKHIVVHMGSSSKLKEWEPKKWVQLIQRIEESDSEVILTGKGEREQAICDEVASQTNATNLCNRLDWTHFVSTIQEARLLISVDSVSVHIAAGSKTPTLVIFSGINPPQLWLPPYPLCKSIMSPVSCSPCYKKQGCSSMSCIRGVGVAGVYQCAKNIMCRDEVLAG